jgi:chaperonin GroES
MKNYKPTPDKVLLLPEPEIQQTESGLMLPTSSLIKPFRAKVVSVADNVTAIKAGDTILYSKLTGVKIDLEGTEYLILRQSDILLIEN